jgi:ATP adenylyltransferase
VVHRGTHNFVILNRYPYTSGHIMVVPYAHVSTLEALPDEPLVELIRLARESETHLRAIYRPGGLNLGLNIGEAAGAGIASHLHLHVLPRWTGDTNFMTTLGETRVLPEELEVTWERLRQAWGGK